MRNYLTLKFPFIPVFHFHFPTVKPIAVHITTREKFVSAEKRYDVECKSSGSRPEAVLTWWKGSRQIKRMAKNVSICAFRLELAPMENKEEKRKMFALNFNDVYLMMPELMSQQTIMVSVAIISMQMVMRGRNQISVDSSETATAKLCTLIEVLHKFSLITA